MPTTAPTRITVSTRIARPVDHVWKHYTDPAHITQWNSPSPDWHCPRAESDLRTGGSFSSRMEAKDGSFGFDFAGTFTNVKPHERLDYALGDDRKVEQTFTKDGDATRMTVTFDAETENPVDMQRDGWQAILDNFKAYAEKQP
jgi:uncharacterized protein YndB with AHSA1/START domain